MTVAHQSVTYIYDNKCVLITALYTVIYPTLFSESNYLIQLPNRSRLFHSANDSFPFIVKPNKEGFLQTTALLFIYIHNIFLIPVKTHRAEVLGDRIGSHWSPRRVDSVSRHVRKRHIISSSSKVGKTSCTKSL